MAGKEKALRLKRPYRGGRTATRLGVLLTDGYVRSYEGRKFILENASVFAAFVEFADGKPIGTPEKAPETEEPTEEVETEEPTEEVETEEPTEEVETEEPTGGYEGMTLAQLRAEGKAQGVAGFSKMNKAELLEVLV